MITRRTFLGGASALALSNRLFSAEPASVKPSADLEKLGAVALAEAKRLKATYCDIRIVRVRGQSVNVRISPARGTGKSQAVPSAVESGSFGFGVRVIANGAWGFASSPFVNNAEIVRITGEAVAVAKANSVLQVKPVELAPVPAYRTRWVTPHEKDPFTVPLAEKLELVPKSVHLRNNIAKILLWIDPKRGVSMQQQLFEPSGDYHLSKYSDIQIDQKIPDSVFKLKTTPKTKIVSPQG